MMYVFCYNKYQMSPVKLSDFFIYRYRYQIGYILLTIFFIVLLAVAGLFVPGGLSKGEERAFVQTASLDLQNINSLSVANLPFYMAQRFSMQMLGPTIFAFKLPAILCAFFAGVGAVLLLRRWFRPNIAVLATAIMITTGQFLYVAQSGTAGITYILWSIWLLLAATMITGSARHQRLWKALFFIVMPLSLYTPLSIYLVVAIFSAGILHPHVRHVLKRMPTLHLIGLSMISLIIVAPLLYLAARQPSLIITLLGAPDAWPPDLFQNIKILVQQYLNFVHPQSGVLMTPVLGLGSIILIGLGAWQLYNIRYTARSYTLTAWILLLVPILIINPSFTAVSFVPLLLLLASGLGFLLQAWYGMFPLNPYARFIGIIPLTVLVAGLVITGVGRYYDGYRHDPETASSFSKDVTIYEREVYSKNITKLLVSNDELAFYNALASYYRNNRPIIVAEVPTLGGFASTHDAHDRVIGAKIERIVTTETSDKSDRFYIFKK